MQRGLRCQTKPTDVARVRRNLRFNENNVKHKSLRNPGKQEKTNQKLISCVPAFFRDLEFTRDELFQFHHVSREFANAFTGFFVRHRILV